MTESPASPETAPRKPSRRSVRLLDLIALVAAVALSLGTPAVIKAVAPIELRRTLVHHAYVEYVAALALYCWTAVLIFLWLADRRANLRQGCREAGPAALVAVAIFFLLLLVQQAALVLIDIGARGWPQALREYYGVIMLLSFSSEGCGAAVVGAWSILVMSGSGQRPSDWFSWSASVLGGLWILLAVVHPMIYFLPIPWIKQSGIG
jgi:hypothetical protein